MLIPIITFLFSFGSINCTRQLKKLNHLRRKVKAWEYERVRDGDEDAYGSSFWKAIRKGGLIFP